MDQTAIQTGSPIPKPVETAVTTGPPPSAVNGTAPKPAKAPVHPLYQALVWLADLRITVTLFVLAILIVFWGTLAQVDFGVWTVVNHYFRCWFTWVPLRVLLFLQVDNSDLGIPFPGGWLIGGAMLVNLLAAHAIRFKLTLARSGIILIHAGIIIMMVGEFITGNYAVEGQMIIPIGKSSNTVVDARSCELAIIHTQPDVTKDDVITIPAAMLKTGNTIDDPRIPFRIGVVEFMVNSKMLDDPKNGRSDKGFGRFNVAEARKEVSGVDPNQMLDTPSVYVKLSSHNAPDLGTWLFSTRFDTKVQWIKVDGKEYQVLLRYKQTSRDFSIYLKDFKHDVFPGTNTPKDFHSYIRLTDPTENVNRDNVEIWMNHPLYYHGETFYQQSWTTDNKGKADGTILQAVRNPGWVMPYVSCFIVGVGMLIHFGITLTRFIDRRIIR